MKVFVINLKKRKDRKKFIINQFKDFKEFDLNVITAIEESKGSLGLWKTFKSIIENQDSNNEDFIIICEDDHKFTKNYNVNNLKENIMIAKKFNADILLGGVSWFNCAIQASNGIFWLKNFNGAQFMIIFKKFFKKIINEKKFSNMEAMDFKLGTLTNNIFVTYPFISTQKEFGYSDVTQANSIKGRVSGLFKSTENKLKILSKVKNHFLPDHFIE